jgi:serine phosphatase RsbU (regulator of sigma subunit)
MSKKIVELESKLRKANADSTDKVDILHQLARIWSREDLKKANKFAKKANSLAQQLQYQKGLVYSRLNRGIFNFFQSEIEKASVYFLDVLDWCEKNGDKRGQADAKNFLGLIYWGFGDFERGFELVSDSLALNQETQDTDRQAWNLNTLGGYHYDSKKYQQSLEYFEKAYALFKKEQDTGGQARALNGIGNNYGMLGDDKKALTYQNKSLKVLQSTDNHLARSKSLNDLSLILQRLGRYEEALEHFNESLTIRQKLGFSTGETTTLLDLGDLFVKQKKFEKASEVINKALELAIQINAKPKISRAYKTLFEIYQDLGQYKKALEFHKKFYTIEKEISHDDIDQKLKHMKVLHELEKSKKESEMLHEELSLARKLQENILPQQLPEVHGISFVAQYLPAMEIGGDFYDVMPLANKRLAILLADVTGHGIQAALSTTLIKLAFRNFQNREVSPASILTGMNEVLHKILPDKTFVAAMVVSVDIEMSHCTIVNGGIPYPSVLKRSNNRVERIPANGLVLGAISKEKYTPGDPVDLVLQQGDCLFLYTDGLSEIENETQEQFDADQLSQVILQHVESSIGEHVNHLVDAARKFSQPQHNWDDITIMAVERKAHIN